jgi:hypothetical protein
MEKTNYSIGFQNFNPLQASSFTVLGEIPYWLEGTYLRNGPGQFHFAEQTVNHWFDGLSLINKFQFTAGKVSYQSTYLNTGEAQHVAMQGKLKGEEFGTHIKRSAFQKINFLRDIKNDYLTLGRVYFPNLNIKEFDSSSKKAIEADILSDFNAGLEGIKALPKGARLGVYIAYVYYLNLLKKITQTSPSEILEKRIRVRNSYKYFLIIRSYLQHSFNSI